PRASARGGARRLRPAGPRSARSWRRGARARRRGARRAPRRGARRARARRARAVLRQGETSRLSYATRSCGVGAGPARRPRASPARAAPALAAPAISRRTSGEPRTNRSATRRRDPAAIPRAGRTANRRRPAAHLQPSGVDSGGGSGECSLIRSLALGLVFGALFLVLAVWGVPLAELRAAFARMEWIYLLHVTVAFAVQYGLRAWRQLVLIRPLAPAADLRSQVAIVLVGFFCVNAFPARLGEAVRPLLFHERHGVPLGAGFGVVFLERVVDLVALFATLLAVLACAEMPERRFALAGGSLSLVEL